MRNYDKAIRNAIQEVKTEISYPSSNYMSGLIGTIGERNVFKMLIKNALKKHKVPNKLIEDLTSVKLRV